jgi:hypothetical protein
MRLVTHNYLQSNVKGYVRIQVKMSRERMCSWKRRPPETFSFLHHFTKLTQ